MSQRKTSQRRRAPYLTHEQMAALTTKRLLAYRKTLVTMDDWRMECSHGDDCWMREHKRALVESKAILDTREHVGAPKKANNRTRSKEQA